MIFLSSELRHMNHLPSEGQAVNFDSLLFSPNYDSRITNHGVPARLKEAI